MPNEPVPPPFRALEYSWPGLALFPLFLSFSQPDSKHQPLVRRFFHNQARWWLRLPPFPVGGLSPLEIILFLLKLPVSPAPIFSRPSYAQWYRIFFSAFLAAFFSARCVMPDATLFPKARIGRFQVPSFFSLRTSLVFLSSKFPSPRLSFLSFPSLSLL